MFTRLIEYKPVSIAKMAKDGKNKNDFYCADILGNKKFATNYGGYPRNDISIINEQSNLAVAKSMLQALPELPVSENSLSDADLLLSCKSKYQQTASEVVGYLEQEISRRYAQRLAGVQKTVTDNTDNKVSVKVDPEEVIDRV